MTRRTSQGDPEIIRRKLIKLLTNFENELNSKDLRSKVLALVPAYKLFMKMGRSLIPKEAAATARDRIIHYFRKYPQIIINGRELMVVSGISEWARRVRELRVQFGWSIISGNTAKEMFKEDEISVTELAVSRMTSHDYILLSKNQDRDAAFRWHKANEIRRKKSGVRDKILDFLLENVGKTVTGEELRYVANNRTEWARRVRELRTEYGWQVITKTTGMPELPIGTYILIDKRQAHAHDRKISDSVRKEVLHRDGYKCVKCRWRYKKWNPSDPRHLEAHHVKPHAKGGSNEEENLITLCNICHDKEHKKTISDIR